MTVEPARRLQEDRSVRESRRPLFSVFVGLVVLMTGVMMFGLCYWRTLSEAAFSRDQSQAFTNSWELAQADATRRLWSIAKMLGADDRVLPLFVAGKRDPLAAIATPWFQALRNNRQLTRLDFIQPDRRVLLRVGEPAVFGDDVSSAPLLAAEQSHETRFGLVVGAAGVEFELVVPLLRNGIITGFLLLGSDFEAMLEDLRAALQADFLLVLDKNRPEFQASSSNAAHPLWRPAHWDRFADLVVAAQSRPGLADGLAPALTGTGGEGDAVLQKGRVWRVVAVPVADAAGHPMGRIDVIRDDTEHQRTAWIALATFGGAIVGVAGLAVLVCYLLLYRLRPALGLTGRQRHDMELMSMRDGLTGLYNRHSIEVLLSKELAHVREIGFPLSVMVVSLDEYRLSDDRVVPGLEDRVAVAVADSLQHQLRLGDLAGRDTHDRFVLVVQRVGGMLAKDVAERLRRAIASTRVEAPSGLLPISACIGVACYPESGTAPAELIAAAEQAVISAKGLGRGQIRMAEI